MPTTHPLNSFSRRSAVVANKEVDIDIVLGICRESNQTEVDFDQCRGKSKHLGFALERCDIKDAGKLS